MKRHALLMLLAVSAIACSKDEDPAASLGSWVQQNDFPGEGRTSALSFSVQGKGYWVLGGNTTNSFLREIWAYDPATDSWTQKNDFPFDVPGVAAAASNEKGYVMSYSGSLYEYSPVADTWKFLSLFPGGNRPGMAAFALGGNLYFGTGNGVIFDANNQPPVFKDFWKYDVSQNKWTAITDFPGVARTEAVSFVIGEKGYVGLGFNGVGAPPIYKDVWSYDATSASWTQVADFPQSDSWYGIVFSNATRGYIGVHENNETHRGIVYEYNPGSNAWRKVQMFPSGSSLETQSFFLNNRNFVVGGWWSESSKQVWEFLP
jgi:N-acetylneuraminic acid mutarotase